MNIDKFKTDKNINKNIFILFTGSTLAQLIPIAIAPILTRLYSPEEFGLLAIFISLAAIFSPIASLRYELSILLPKSNSDAKDLAYLCFGIICFFTLIFFVIILFARILFFEFFIGLGVGNYIFLLPVLFFLMGTFNVFNQLKVRVKDFKIITFAVSLKAIGISLIQASLGFLKIGSLGLIMGQIIGITLAILYFLSKTPSILKVTFNSLLKRTKKLAIRYKNFPLFSSAGALANSASFNLLTFLISIFYSVSTLGFFSLASRMLAIPTGLISQSIGQVYFEAARTEYHITANAKETFKLTAKKLIFISLIIFLPLYFLTPTLFKFYFGDQWLLAGIYAQSIIPYIAVQFIVSPLQLTFEIFEKQKVLFFWQIGLLFISLFILLISSNLGITFLNFLNLYSLSLAVYYSLSFLIISRMIYWRKNNDLYN